MQPERIAKVVPSDSSVDDPVSNDTFLQRRRDQIASAIDAANVPIVFWGEAIDAGGLPVEGVDVEYSIQQPKKMWDTHSVSGRVKSDSNGRFQIGDHLGNSLSIDRLSKEGYVWVVENSLSFGYHGGSGLHVPDAKKPVIFTLIKESELSKINRTRSKLRLNWHGEPVFFDIKTGKIAAKGQIKISAYRGPALENSTVAKFDWQLRLEAVDGEVVEVPSSESHKAPKAGYKESWNFGFKKEDPNWRSSTKGNFTYLFVRFRNGTYARITLFVDADQKRRNSSGSIECAHSPSGGLIFGR